jgi:hypothetical protein
LLEGYGPEIAPVDLRSSRRASRFHADAPPQVTQEGGDDRVSGTDAERDDDIYHNGTSGFGGNADRSEMADLGHVLINAQIAAPKALRLLHGCGLTRKQADKSSLCKITLDDFERPQMGGWLRDDFSATDHHRSALVLCGK